MVARDEHKVRVIARQLSDEYGVKVLGFHIDLRKMSAEDEFEDIVNACLSQYGTIDVLINGAAGNFLVKAEELSLNGFKAVMEIDTVGTFLASKVLFNKAFKP